MAVKRRQKALSSGRPPITNHKEHMSSKQTRTIIRTHHRLHKQHAAALKKGDSKAVEALKDTIEKNGGLGLYQQASILGQSKLRGGDSSKVLVDWLQQANVLSSSATPADSKAPLIMQYRLLEVGALSTKNEISKFPSIIDVTRIDLNSQGPGIEQQDFMERPLPKSADERFDIISLSLVLNYVPEATQRGEMLKRISQFLRRPDFSPDDNESVLPALFIVLPLPCVQNSRYLDEQLLMQIMSNLGFMLRNKKDTAKLCHYLFAKTGNSNGAKTVKKLLKDRSTMNNFCVIVN
jgi:25S rRNA (adenine2142-N1)-methyltransferase